MAKEVINKMGRAWTIYDLAVKKLTAKLGFAHIQNILFLLY